MHCIDIDHYKFYVFHFPQYLVSELPRSISFRPGFQNHTLPKSNQSLS